jgi:hypothetical protein
MKTHFKQPCPVCGRPLYVPVDLLGRDASCSHCSGVFTANDSDDESLSCVAPRRGKQSETMYSGRYWQMSCRRLQGVGC